MGEDLANADWTAVRTESVEKMWDFFRARVREALDKHVPVRPARSRLRPAWLTQQIVEAIRRKQRLWERAKKGRDVEEYKTAEKDVKRMIRNAKQNFEKRLADGNGGNTRPFYSYIKQRTKSKPGIDPLKNQKMEIVAEDQGMAELLNNFFSCVYEEDTEHIPMAENMETNTMEEVNITEKMVREKIRKLKPDSAAGPDKIGPRKLEELEAVLTTPLVEIFRKSISTGEGPDEWKIANVTPIFKKGIKKIQETIGPSPLLQYAEKCLNQS
jgi:hypothetical protein